MATKFLKCKLFNETLAFHLKNTPGIKDAYLNFARTKSENAMQKYGASDYPMTGKFKGLLHAHLTQDVSIVYSLSGSNPHVIKLAAVGTHAELGTGKTPNPKKQEKMSNLIKNQTFFERKLP